MHLFQLIQKPVYQALVCILLTILLTFIVKPKNADTVWVICGLVFGLFILANAVLAVYADHVWQYFFISLGFSLLYVFLIAFIAKALITILKLEGSEESAMIFMYIIFHPVALLLTICMKWLFE